MNRFYGTRWNSDRKRPPRRWESGSKKREISDVAPPIDPCVRCGVTVPTSDPERVKDKEGVWAWDLQKDDQGGKDIEHPVGGLGQNGEKQLRCSALIFSLP